MGNNRITWVCAAFVLFMTAGSANATYIGSFKGNDNDNWDTVDKFLSKSGYSDITKGSLELLGKTDEGINAVLDDNLGTWSLDPTDQINLDDIGFISVKAANRTYVFRADDFNYLFGDEGGKPLFKHGVSHISFWKADGYGGPGPGPGPGGQVPEPATIFLLGSGLLGFLGYRKKFRKPKN